MATIQDYNEFAKDLLPLVGGAENVKYLTHCMTRLRFSVINKDNVQREAIESLPVQASIWVGDQFQVVIGNDVDKAYEAVRALGNFEATEKLDENLDADKPKERLTLKSLGTNLLTTLTECVAPLIPMMVGMGMFASLTAVLGPGFLNVLAADSALYQFFSLAANAITYLLPLMVAYSSAKKFGCSPVFAIAVTGFLYYPDALTAITSGTFNIAGYTPSGTTPQIFSVVLMCWVLAYVERFLNRVIPSALQLSFVSFLSMVVTIPLFIYVLAPIGSLLSNVISWALTSIYTLCPPLVPFLVGLLWVLLIIPGMHVAVSMAFIANFMATGVDYMVYPVIMPLCCIGCAVNLGILFRNKSEHERELCLNGIVSVLIGGVLEPSLYGLYLKSPRRMLACCLGQGTMGLLMGVLHVGMYSASSSNFMFITSFISGGMQNLLLALVSIAAGVIVAFLVAASEKKEAAA